MSAKYRRAASGGILQFNLFFSGREDDPAF